MPAFILQTITLCQLGVRQSGWISPPPIPRTAISLYSFPIANDTHPADGEDHTRLARADTHEAVAELPVEEMLTDESDETEGHGCSQHVEDTCHVIYIQLAAHNLILLIVTNASEPERFQLLHLP